MSSCGRNDRRIRFLLRASESRILRRLRMTLSQQQPRSVPPGSVILKEERLKDPLLVASLGVSDPSQAQDDIHARRTRKLVVRPFFAVELPTEGQAILGRLNPPDA